jgi:hypothetical protein
MAFITRLCSIVFIENDQSCHIESGRFRSRSISYLLIQAGSRSDWLTWKWYVQYSPHHWHVVICCNLQCSKYAGNMVTFNNVFVQNWCKDQVHVVAAYEGLTGNFRYRSWMKVMRAFCSLSAGPFKVVSVNWAKDIWTDRALPGHCTSSPSYWLTVGRQLNFPYTSHLP